MPYKLYPPQEGVTPYWQVRGTEFGIYCKRSTKTAVEREARQIMRAWREEAKRLSVSGAKREVQGFASAARDYVLSGRSELFLTPLVKHFGETPLDEIDQAAIDRAAAVLGGTRKPQTNNRLVYTPVIAILRHAGITTHLRRPKTHGGGHRIDWLKPDEAFRLLEHANGFDRRLGALLCFLLYTGVRLSEALRLEWKDVDLSAATAHIGRTKNGSPITVHLNAETISALANLPKDVRLVFGLSKCGRLYEMLSRAWVGSNTDRQPGNAFHVLRHTHAMYRRLYTGADTSALVATGLWKSRNAASVYEHIDIKEESKKSALFPTPKRMR